MNYWIFQCIPENHKSWESKRRKDWEWGRNNSDTKRAINGAVKCFNEAKIGDKVLCYVGYKMEFVAIFKIHNKRQDKRYKEVIVLELISKISVALKNINYKQNDFPFLKNHQGTYYQITKNQFKFICDLNNSIDDSRILTNKNIIKQIFTTRHETGAKAEDIFKEYYKIIPKFNGAEYKDMRLSGVGYDFELSKNGKRLFVEVKGIGESKVCESVLFTPKEWEVASKNGKSYFLVIVNISQNTMQVVQNPSQAKESKNTIKIEMYNVNIKSLCDDKNLYEIKDLQ